jgi:chromosome segregation ATPase
LQVLIEVKMPSQYQECLELSQNLASEVQALSKKVENLRSEVSKTSSFGFDGLDLKERVDALQGEVSELRQEINSTKDSIQYVSKNASFSSSQVERITEIWQQMLKEAKGVESSLQKVERTLKETNFWARLAYGFDEIYKEIREMIVDLSKPILKQAQKALKKAKDLILPGWED